MSYLFSYASFDFPDGFDKDVGRERRRREGEEEKGERKKKKKIYFKKKS